MMTDLQGLAHPILAVTHEYMGPGDKPVLYYS
jgi:hypothetical protein